MAGVFVVIVLIALICWGLPKMIATNNKIERGERTFFSDIVKAIFGTDRK